MWNWLVAVALAGEPGPWVQAAVADHASRQAVSARVEAARAEAEVAGRWPDLMASLAYTGPWTTGWFGDHPMAGIDAGLTQRLMPPRWSAARRSVADARADRAAADEALVVTALAQELYAAWWQAAALAARAPVLDAHLAAIDLALASADARRAVGRGREADRLRLALLREQVAQQRADVDEALAALRAQVQARSRALPDGAAGPVLPDGPPRPGSSGSVEGSPAVQQRQAEASLARAQAATQAAARGVPVDLKVGVRGRTFMSPTDPGVDLFTVGVTVPLPTTSLASANAAAAAATHRARAAEASAEDAERQVAAAVASAQGRWRAAVAAVDRLDAEQLPLARQLRDTVLASFEAGEATGQDLYEATRDLLALELSRIDRVAAACSAQAAVSLAAGWSPEEAP